MDDIIGAFRNRERIGIRQVSERERDIDARQVVEIG